MKIKNQVCNLQLAKKLKELGVKQESLFDWCDIDDNEFILMARKPSASLCEGCISAFTVAELLQMLKEPVLVPVDGSAADYLADLIIKQQYAPNQQTK